MWITCGATKKSIRLRILKHKHAREATRKAGGYKKIDPFADTETPSDQRTGAGASGYKKIDPFADTETRRRFARCGCRLCYKKIDPFADTETPCLRRRSRLWGGYKKIDPFADTETCAWARGVCRGFWATKKSIRLRILKPSDWHGNSQRRGALQKNRSVCGY